MRDLQDDISNLKEQLRHHDDETSAGQRRHVQDVRQLQQQNEALSEQLRQVSLGRVCCRVCVCVCVVGVDVYIIYMCVHVGGVCVLSLIHI